MTRRKYEGLPRCNSSAGVPWWFVKSHGEKITGSIKSSFGDRKIIGRKLQDVFSILISRVQKRRFEVESVFSRYE